MSILDEICACKRQEVEKRKCKTPLKTVKNKAEKNHLSSYFKKSIQDFKDRSKPALIAEIKKASPSEGIIRNDFEPGLIAKAYEAGGAACLSVLTDEKYFKGKDQYIGQAKVKSALPVLRKDFIIDPYQVYETKALGADCLLLIMAALDDRQAAKIYSLATSLGLDVLVEVHNQQELDRALELDPEIVGVNNRNLKTMEISLQTSLNLIEAIPAPVIKISESGIYTHNDLMSLHDAGYDGFLVGSSLMKQDNLISAVKNLLNS